MFLAFLFVFVFVFLSGEASKRQAAGNAEQVVGEG